MNAYGFYLSIGATPHILPNGHIEGWLALVADMWTPEVGKSVQFIEVKAETVIKVLPVPYVCAVGITDQSMILHDPYHDA